MKKLLIVSALVFICSMQSATAATGDAEGWAWGGGVDSNPPGYDGIGWVSMNSSNCDADNNTFPDVVCGGNNTSGTIIPYAVNIPSAVNVNISGYAWSENYGWISFNLSDLSGCPGGGTCGARKVGDDILGWARIISICDTGNAGDGHTRDGHCDGGDDGWNAGGWNGWISLSDLNFGGSNYGLKISKMDKSGSNPTYAFSEELGWIDFSKTGLVSTLKICPNSCTGGGTPYDSLASFSSFSSPLLACYGTGTCTSGDTNVSGTWIESNSPEDAIALSTLPSTPALSTTVTPTYSGTTSADEDITLRYTPVSSPMLQVTARAHVACVPLQCSGVTAQTDAYCPTEVQSLNNACAGVITCPGTRKCNYNFIETTP